MGGFGTKPYSLKGVLEDFYRDYDFQERISHDPIEFPRRYKRPEDIEVSGFIASCLAYGRVDLFKPVIGRLLSFMGESPYDFILSSPLKRCWNLCQGVSYRFNRSDDFVSLFYVLKRVLRRYGRLEAAFQAHYRQGDENTRDGLSAFVRTFLDVDTSAVYARDTKPEGFLQFFPSPEKGSSCKRMNLFLRWMVRDRDIDLGIWKSVPKDKLVIPLDTHIARISRCLGFTRRMTQDWKMAVEITQALKHFDPEDPLKYDFALCHQGIMGLCRTARCKDCGFPVMS